MNEPTSTIPSITSATLFDEAACQKLAEQMAEDFEGLCIGFMAEMTEAVRQIAALSENNVSEISQLAHKYKSPAGYLGAIRLRELLIELEARADSGDKQACSTLAQQALKVNQDTLIALQAFLDQQRITTD